MGLTIVAGLVGSLLFGLPALEPDQSPGQQSQHVRRRPTADWRRAARPEGGPGSGRLDSLTGHSPPSVHRE